MENFIFCAVEMVFKALESEISSRRKRSEQSEQSSSNDKHTSLNINNGLTTLSSKLQNTF